MSSTESLPQTSPESQNAQPSESDWDSLGKEVPFTSNTESNRRLAEYYEKKAQIKKRLEKESEELISAMDKLRKKQHEARQHERALELTERKFNEALTTPDQLEEAVLSGEDGISMSKIEYEGNNIPIYELEGYPMRWLQHVVDFRSNENQVGYNTSREIIADPSKWLSSVDGMSQRQFRNVDMMTDNISTSYVDAQINLSRNGGCRSASGITYGFSHIPGGTMINLSNRDAGATERAGNAKGLITNYRDPDQFSSYQGNSHYNEVTIQRYSENGTPLTPDFMILRDRDSRWDQLSEDTLRHAAYWKIPIVRVHDQPYIDQATKKAINQVKGLDENAPYQDLFSTIQSANSSNMFSSNLLPLKTVYTSPEKDTYLDEVKYHDNTDTLGNVGDKFRHLVTEIEPIRRIDFIKEALTAQDQGTLDNITVFLNTTELKHDEHYVPTYGTQITIKAPNIPETIIREDSPEYAHIMPAVEAYRASGGLTHDLRHHNTP